MDEVILTHASGHDLAKSQGRAGLYGLRPERRRESWTRGGKMGELCERIDAWRRRCDGEESCGGAVGSGSRIGRPMGGRGTRLHLTLILTLILQVSASALTHEVLII